MKTILIIDDDENCRSITAKLLEQWGWRALEAENGEDGLALAKEHRPALILCDLLMPRGNGYQFCRALRQQPEVGLTPVVVMSGRDYPQDRQSAVEAGANDFLLKPVKAEDLRAVIARAVPPASEGTPTIPATPLDEVLNAGALVRFWGVRGSIPTPGASTVYYGGNTSCVEVRTEGEILVLDAGTGIRELGTALAREFRGKPIALTLLISHTHWDHIQGFPFFMPAYAPNNQIRILGYEGARAGLAATLAGQMESPYFPIPLKQMPGNVIIEELREMKFKVGGVTIESCFSKHPGVCVGYRIHTSGGAIVYLPDNEWNSDSLAGTNNGGPCTPEQSLLEFVRGAEVLIIDAQYDEAEYQTHVGWGHGCVDDVVRLALTAGVKRLFLFHHDPAHDDAFLNGMLAHAQALVRESGATLQVEIAREGAVVSVPAGTQAALSPEAKIAATC